MGAGKDNNVPEEGIAAHRQVGSGLHPGGDHDRPRRRGGDAAVGSDVSQRNGVLARAELGHLDACVQPTRSTSTPSSSME